MNNFAYPILLVTFLTACGGGGESKLDCTVEVNSDSVLNATYLPERPMLTFQRLAPGWKLDDRAVDGLTLNDLSKGYDLPFVGSGPTRIGPQGAFASIPHPSQVVVLAVGGNDAYEHRDPAVFKAQLEAAVSYLQAQGKVVVLTGIVPVVTVGIFDEAWQVRRDELNRIAREVAQATGATHAGFDTSEFHGMEETVDGAHRTQPAADRLVRQLLDTINQTYPGCK